MTDKAQAAASALVGAQSSRAHQEDGHYESDDASDDHESSDVSDGNDSSQASDEDESNQAGPSDYNEGYLDVDQ